MTGDWATIAFHSRTRESSASFDIKAATITASGTVWGEWSEHASYPKRHGPTRQDFLSDDEVPPEEALDQCIFIDPFRIADLAWYKRVRLDMMQKSGTLALSAHSGAAEGHTSASQVNPYSTSRGSSSRAPTGPAAGAHGTVSVVLCQTWNYR